MASPSLIQRIRNKLTEFTRTNPVTTGGIIGVPAGLGLAAANYDPDLVPVRKVEHDITLPVKVASKWHRAPRPKTKAAPKKPVEAQKATPSADIPGSQTPPPGAGAPPVTPTQDTPGLLDNVRVGHLVGAVPATLGSYWLADTLLTKQREAELEDAVAGATRTFTNSLINEQLSRRLNKSGAVYDRLNGLMGRSIADFVGEVKKQMVSTAQRAPRVDKKGNPLPQTMDKDIDNPLASTVLLGGLGAGGLIGVNEGYRRTVKSDPNRVLVDRVKEDIKRRLGHRGRVIMRVSSIGGSPAMQPIRPGASAIVNPNNSSDVLGLM